MTGKQKREWVDEYADEHELKALCADGYEDAIMGFVYRKGLEPIVLYDRAKCISILMKRDGMTHEEAEEFFSFNTDDAWTGEGTPAWAILIGKE